MSYLSLNELLKGKMPKNISIDKEAKAIYFKLSDAKAVRTERANNSLSIDYDKDGEMIGIEIIRVQKIELLLKKALKDIYSSIPRKTLVFAS